MHWTSGGGWKPVGVSEELVSNDRSGHGRRGSWGIGVRAAKNRLHRARRALAAPAGQRAEENA